MEHNNKKNNIENFQKIVKNSDMIINLGILNANINKRKINLPDATINVD